MLELTINKGLKMPTKCVKQTYLAITVVVGEEKLARYFVAGL